MTRIMIDFLDLPEQKVEIRQSAAIEMIRTRGNVFTTNQASYLLRNWTDNSAEIKRRAADYKNTEIITPFVRTKWTQHTLAHMFLFCVASQCILS